MRALACHVVGFVLLERELGQARGLAERSSLDAGCGMSAAALVSELIPA